MRLVSRTTPTFSVVICAYTDERWDDLIDAVTSIRTQSLPAREIIVVIDHNPGLLRRARASFDDATVLENAGRQGLSGARNSGVAIAGGDVIAFLDDDATAMPDWLARLAARYDDPEVLGVGGFIAPRWAIGRPAWFPAEFSWVVGCSYTGLPLTTAPVRNLIGANMSVRRDVIASVGGFHSEVGQIGASMLRCDDTDFCIRLRQRWPNRPLLYEPTARVSHHVTAGRSTWRYFSVRCYTEGMAKALLAQMVGTGDGLSSERAYTLRILPRGVIRSIAMSLRGDVGGARRAGAIVTGLMLTTGGYLRSRVTARFAMKKASDAPKGIATR